MVVLWRLGRDRDRDVEGRRAVLNSGVVVAGVGASDLS